MASQQNNCKCPLKGAKKSVSVTVQNIASSSSSSSSSKDSNSQLRVRALHAAGNGNVSTHPSVGAWQEEQISWLHSKWKDFLFPETNLAGDSGSIFIPTRTCNPLRSCVSARHTIRHTVCVRVFFFSPVSVGRYIPLLNPLVVTGPREPLPWK